MHADLKETALKEWRRMIVQDQQNNEFYIKDYSSVNGKYNRLPIDNNVPNKFETFEMSKEVVCDIVGKHQYYQVGEYNPVSGLLYQDFLV